MTHLSFFNFFKFNQRPGSLLGGVWAWRATCYSRWGCLQHHHIALIVHRDNVSWIMSTPTISVIRKVGAYPLVVTSQQMAALSSMVANPCRPISMVANQHQPTSMVANPCQPISMVANPCQPILIVASELQPISIVANPWQPISTNLPHQVLLFHQRLGYARPLYLLLIGELQVFDVWSEYYAHLISQLQLSPIQIFRMRYPTKGCLTFIAFHLIHPPWVK